MKARTMATPSQSASPSAPAKAAELASQLNDLNDQLLMETAILRSLDDFSSTPQEKEDCRASIEQLKIKIKETRHAHHKALRSMGSTGSKPKPKATMHNQQGPQFPMSSWDTNNWNHNNSGDDGFGLQSNDTTARPSTPSARKRTYSQANVTPVRGGSSSRARHNSPSPQAPNTSSSTGSSAIIDLTGDDEEMMRIQQTMVYDHFAARNRVVQQEHRELAQRYQQHGYSPAAATAPGVDFSTVPYFQPAARQSFPFGNSSSATPNNRAAQLGSNSLSAYGSVSTPQAGQRYTLPLPRPGPSNGSGPFRASNGTQPQASQPYSNNDMPRVPGAYIDLDDEPDVQFLHANTIPASMSYSQGLQSANEAERTAALSRRHFPGTQIPGYSASTQLNPNAINRPGYIYDGRASSSQVAGSQSDRFVPGSSLLPPHLANGGLSSIINRTNGFDYNTFRDADGNPFDARIRDYLEDLADDPRKTAEEMKKLLDDVRPDMDIPVEERGQTPEALKYPLYPHQQVSLKWMFKMEEASDRRGGILADDMGLGKTISTLALMVSRKSTSAIKTNLIIGPVALIKQWEVEIRKKLKPAHRLKVFLLHGKKLAYSELMKYDVVLTTFGTLGSEWTRFNKRVLERREDGNYNVYDDLELHRKCPLIHPRSKFYRVVLDEAQNIKNKNALASKGAAQIDATYRWCLTGTPMMNNVGELFPLIRFLRASPYNSIEQFNREFSVLAPNSKRRQENSYEVAMSKLRVFLQTILLRRMKDSELDGKPILTLPPKTEIIHNCVFSPDEHAFYKTLESKAQVTFNRYLRAGTVSKNYAHVLVLLLRLRQACCHPHLNMDFDYATALPEETKGMMEEFAKSLAPAVVDRLKESEAFDCPICFDGVENPIIFVPCGHDTCGECFIALTENSRQLSARGEEGMAGSALKCPECRGDVFPNKVINYTAFRKVHMPETIEAPPDDENVPVVDDDDDDSDDGDSSDEDSDDDADQYGDLRDFIVRDDEEVDDNEADDGDTDLSAETADGQPKKTKKGKRSKRQKKSKKGKAKEEEVKPHMLQTLRKEASKNIEARKRYMRYLRKNWESSAKVDKICEILKDIQPSGEKTIIFSQWTALLDLLEIPIKHELKIKSRRYDGGMSRAQRDESINRFVEDPDVKILLVSLRAGNAGLNLTVASQVIICDPFWNPFVEMQAVDRAHRIGQQLPVQVHRVVVKSRTENTGEGTEADETVEDRILALQEKKRELINGALDEKAGRAAGRLSDRDLARLFGA